ncbi:hypothetical protein BZG36_04189 [Bifiguratus adelaidae]|uniref:Choline/ethanolaminephosphotransferase 1 n=1 Tax=Bifiguratus adelaidae TaxID=1938954 RepID=A0A261XW64_9FUNG|nr:hypothetical protein BZG36_04189 [Bifiguratus adelaidae]
MFKLSASHYVSDESLANLKLYKYAAVDKSPTTHYILRHYWNWAVELFPLWMAPNLITLCGLGFVLVNLICVILYIPDMVGPGPAWLYFSCSLGLWLYSTFDNVDGKQARRTGTSSPLGELFDHGCDALNCSIGAIVEAACMSFGHSWYAAFLLLMTTIPFYLSTWEEYHTGVLYLGYINGPTEGLVMACAVMALSGIYGPQLWKMPLRHFVPVDKIGLAEWSLQDSMVAVMVFLMIFVHFPFCFMAVYRVCKAKNKSFLYIAIVENVPIVVYTLSGYAWLASPYSYIFRHEHFILFAVTVGIVFGRIATKIILAHVTKSAFPMFTILQVPLVAGAIIMNLPVYLDIEPILDAQGEYRYLQAFFCFAVLAYANWAYLVIDRFCNYLGIKCLSIPYPPKKTQ